MVRRILTGAIRVYQRALSPLTPGVCRYHPTCSEYARRALERHGVVRGGWLALRRILRCHPWGGRGYDPVPGLGDPHTEPDGSGDPSTDPPPLGAASSSVLPDPR